MPGVCKYGYVPLSHRYENGNNNENRQAMIIAINHHRNIALERSVINLLGNGSGEGREFIDFTCAQPSPWIFLWFINIQVVLSV